MINWLLGGCTGSIRRWVAREIRQHMRTNPAIQTNKYSASLRLLRAGLFGRSYGYFIGLYLLVLVVLVFLDFAIPLYTPESFPEWASPTDLIKSALRDTTGFLIAAQVGALTIVSLAVGLISIIVGRRGSGATMDVYYNESLASEVLASSLALLTVLCVQLLWPAQTALHIFGFGSRTLIFKVSLTLIHIVWLVFNLAGLAHFADLSFQFVQPRSRTDSEIRYTANQAVPRQMRHTLSRVLYMQAGEHLLSDWDPQHDPLFVFGHLFGHPRATEIDRVFVQPTRLFDVRVRALRWVLRRWSRRCRSATTNSAGRYGRTAISAAGPGVYPKF